MNVFLVSFLTDGSLIYTPVPNKELPVVNNASPTLLKRRAYEEINGMDGRCLSVPFVVV